MKLRKPWQRKLASLAGAAMIRSLGVTWRVEIRWPDKILPGFYMFPHGQILLATWTHRGKGYPILIGTHRDGELIAAIAQRFGYVPIRGSSTRGGSRAALEILRKWRGTPVAITPDGPRGPRGSVKPGLVQLAGIAGVPLVPMSFVAHRKKQFDSWDRFTLPGPFARILSTFGEPLFVPPDVDEAAAEALALEAGRRLLETEALAESEVSRW